LIPSITTSPPHTLLVTIYRDRSAIKNINHKGTEKEETRKPEKNENPKEDIFDTD